MVKSFLKEYGLFYLSLAWLLVPIYYVIKNQSLLFLIFPILMGVCDIILVHTKNRKSIFIKCCWLYMGGYTFYICYQSPQAAMMLMYMATIIGHAFEETDIKSFYNVTYYTLFVIIATYTLVFAEIVYLEKFIVIMALFFVSLYSIIVRDSIITTRQKEEENIKNKYINNLLAENERNRIGSDLHDTLGHLFATITLKSELALKLLEKGQNDALKKELVDLNELTKKSMKEVRGVVNDLKFRSFSEELANTKDILKLANISLEIKNLEVIEKLSPPKQNMFVMLLREFINNVLKHSKAKNVKLAFFNEAKELRFIVQDDGVGFTQLTGEELHSIKGRLEIINGNVTITSVANPTEVTITIPHERGI